GAQPGGVDQLEGATLDLEPRVDAVARRAGDLRDDDALLADEPVHERALADVRAPDEGDARPRRRGLGRGVALARRREPLHELLERVPRATAVLRRDRVAGGEAEAREIGQAGRGARVGELVPDEGD